MEENMKEILKYLKSIAKSLETIAKVENEENKREILEKENISISQKAKDEITSSLKD